MERILHYEIKASDDSPTVACFLKRQGYSSANLTDLKKMPESILINGTPSYMIRHLQGGDRLTVHIQETAVSEKIPPVYHPLDIVYEDEDLMVTNKPADLPIHPSMRNYTHSLANGLAWYFAQKDCPFVFRCINRPAPGRILPAFPGWAAHRTAAGSPPLQRQSGRRGCR